jgi:hypothetical protein
MMSDDFDVHKDYYKILGVSSICTIEEIKVNNSICIYINLLYFLFIVIFVY